MLVIRLDRDIEVDVGAKGRLDFGRGLYAYVGSAQNNLEKRVSRHLRKDKRKFWHVDYLLGDDSARVVEVFHKLGDRTEECRVAGFIGERAEPMDGFGASDCGCRSHLFRIEDYGFLEKSMFVLDLKALRPLSRQ